MRLGIILLILGSVLNAKADVFRCFSEEFFNENIYDPFKCHKNIRNLISKCKIYEHKNAEVMFLYSSQKSSFDKRLPLTPMMARSDVKEWGYHVILKVNDKIYDFDYDNYPQEIDLTNYSDSMFTNHDEIEVRTIPAMNYLIYYRDLPEFYIYNHLGVLSESKTLTQYLGRED